MGYDLFAVQEPGQPETWSYPALNDDLSLRWESIDGQVIGPFVATAVSEMIKDTRKNKFVKECGIEDTEIYCYITESRFVFVCPKYDKGGGWSGGGLDPVGALTGIAAAAVANAVSKRRAANRSRGTALVGQVRHPWAWCVQFWQKTGWGTAETVRLYYTDPDGPTRYAEIVLSKNADAADIAYKLTQSIVRYRLSDRDPKDEQARAELTNLLAAGPARIAARGELTDYDIPGDHFIAGAGEKFAPLYPPSSGKNVPVAAPPPKPEQPTPHPQEQKKWHGIVSTFEPNEPEDWCWPTINDDLTIRFDALDGDVIGPLAATDVTNYMIYDKGGRPREEPDCWVKGDNISVFITEARLVYVRPDAGTNAGAPRTARGGQLRYPWVCMLEFQTKQNWLTEEMLRLFYEDDEGLQILAVTFNKGQSAAALAAMVAQRIAAYQLAATNPKDPSTIEQLKRMRATDHLPTPRKYDYTSVDIPVYSRMGSGQEHAPTEAPSRLLGNHGAGRDGSAPTPGALRFNPPPNWPPPPPGWAPPPGWKPDPSWPTPPPGWKLWV